MALFAASLVLLLAMAGHSDASYCVCSSGGDNAFQKNIDYACGAGADCSAILQNGACYNPNTVRDHCNYAVNSYYQRKGQAPGSCEFSGTATVSQTVPNAASGCVYQSSPSTGGGSTTPANNPTTTTIGGGPPNTSGTMPGFVPPGAGFSNPDGSGAGTSTSTSTHPWLTIPIALMLFFGLLIDV